MRFITPLALLLAAAIHLLPVSGAFSNAALFKLYRVQLTDPNLIVLLRHRAAMFGVIAVFMLVACFETSLRPAAFAVGFASATTFIAIAWQVGGYSKAIARVVTADLVALAALAIGFVVSLADTADNS
jgi:hypothetical protein